ncbi:MAG: polysaccharide deacetylase family protein, partial [Planctomycetota bacterium]
MPDREQLIRLYRTLTGPGRHLLRWQMDRTSGFPIAILFYHRVADDVPNDWTISCADFAMHLDWLQSEFELVGLPEVQRRLREGRCSRPTAAISFDDGYADNCAFAIPELLRRGIPATYFVSTDFVREQKPFPHDLRAGQPLAPNTIEQIRSM